MQESNFKTKLLFKFINFLFFWLSKRNLIIWALIYKDDDLLQEYSIIVSWN